MKRLAVRILTGSVLMLSLVAFAQPKPAAKKGAAATAKAGEKKDAAKDSKDAKKKPEVRKGPAQFKDVPKLEDAEKEALADKKRDESVESLKKIIPKFEDGNPDKAELLFQLSEFYWEKSKFLNRQEMLKFQEDEKKYDEARNRGEKAAEAKEDHRQSELYRSETMRLYENILREYPAYNRKDEVLFSLGYNLYEVNKKDQAVKRYVELIKNYPGSKFVPDTYIQLGNHYFDVANKLPEAKEMYEKAFGSTIPKIKSYALYKLAWCDFNLGEHEKALKKLQDVIDYAEKQGKQFTDLKNEALNDSVLMFVQLNRPDDAMAYYKAHAGKKKAVSLTSRLAFALADAGHHESAIKSFRFLLSDNPVAEAAPDFTQAIMKSYEGLRQRENVKAEVKKMAELYRPGSTWWKANESKKEVLRNGFSVAEEAMRTIVTEYHVEAQKTKQVETYRLARDIYKQYIDAFASSDDENFVSDFAFNLKFFYAEILWALEEWEPAAKQYDEVVAFKIPSRDMAKEAANEKYRQSSSFNAILAWEKLVKIERGLLAKSDLKEGAKIDETKKKGEVTKQAKIQKRSAKELEEQKLTKNESALVAACDKYNSLFPNNSEEIDVRYQAAVVYYDRNHFVEVARRFGEIILKWPEEKRSAEAADLSMGVLEEKEEWLELNKLARQFIANKKLSKPNSDFTKRVAGLVEGSQYKYVDEVIYKKEKNPKKAAEEFVKFVAEFPASNNADRALTYAQGIYQEATEFDRAIETAERVLKEYPSTIYDIRLKYSLAWMYEKTAQFERSAAMYEDFINTYDAAAGARAANWDNVKDLLKKEKEAKEKEAKTAAKGKPAAKPAVVVKPVAPPAKMDAKVAEQRAKDRDVEVKTAGLGVEKKPGDKTDPVGERIADAQFNAALWWEGVGKSDKALTAYGHYLARFKDKKDVPEIAFNQGLIFEKDKKLGDALKIYDTFLTSYAKDSRVTDLKRFEVRYREYQIHERLKLAAEGTKGAASEANKELIEMEKLAKELAVAYPKLSAEEKKNDRALAAYANIRFFQLEPMWKQYTEIKFNRLATLKNDFAAKTKKIQEVEKSYAEVLGIGAGEYGIAALTRIGMAYSDYAQNFLDSPDPKGLDEDQREMYRGELENKAFPLEEKAIEAFDKALAKSYELSIYNQWTLDAQNKINKYRPGAYTHRREVPYRGSEFFVTAPFEKSAAIAPVETAPTKPAEAPKPGSTTTSAAAATPGAR